MKKKVSMIVLLVGMVLLLTGVMFVLMQHVVKVNSKSEEPVINPEMFSAYTDCEIFQPIPAMPTEKGVISKAEDYGNKDWLINISGSTTDEYKAYLEVLEKAGFVKHSDNGEDAMEGYAYTTSFTKENVVLTVSHAIKQNHTYIMASEGRKLSPHLIYDESWKENAPKDAKTSVHMLELHDIGNSFVIQLKNGHFVVHDGGQDMDAPYLLDYLEALTPGEEKPLIEAWFVSHAHSDHNGALRKIANDQTSSNRIYVDGIYFVQPNISVYLNGMDDQSMSAAFTEKINVMFKNKDGETAKIYRPQFGQRYWFCDVAIDVSLTMEQFPVESWFYADFNDTSTWLMHHIDGQRFLIAGDAHHAGMRVAMNMFEKEYFDLDVFAVFHHGINVWNYFTDYCKLKTVLYTNFQEASPYDPVKHPTAGRGADNEHLRQSCEEYVSHGGGTVVLTFPYQVGEYKKMPPSDWRYDGGVQRKDNYN